MVTAAEPVRGVAARCWCATSNSKGTLDEDNLPHWFCLFVCAAAVHALRRVIRARAGQFTAKRDAGHLQACHLQLRLQQARCDDPDARRREAPYHSRDSEGSEEGSYFADPHSIQYQLAGQPCGEFAPGADSEWL